jgi:predicted transcriptional regulator
MKAKPAGLTSGWLACFVLSGGLGWNAVKQPFVNVEEKIDRFVGRRTRTPDGLKAGMRMQAAGLEFHKAFKHRWLAKGVHRFKTHEEADQWMIKMLVRSGM